MINNIGMPASAIRLLAMFEFDKQPATRHARLILAQTHGDEYVVSAQYGDRDEGSDMKWDQSWSQGHYFDDLEAARDYFVERCGERR